MSKALGCWLLVFALRAMAQPVLPAVEVVNSAPLPGLGLPLEQVPSHVQSMKAADDVQGLLPGQLETVMAGPQLSASQGNGYQPDVLYRGFAASPVLGGPQGLSVFQDGVRLNESFGDAVNWDLLLPAAIARIDLLPAANASFGLNTLGGALLLRTRNGFDSPGSSARLQAGSAGHAALAAQLGSNDGTRHLFIAADRVHDLGWAAHNGSSLARAFGKLGWRDGRGRLDLSLSLADNEMQGLQAVPRSLDPWSGRPYTWPDINRNRLAMLIAQGSRAMGAQAVLDFNAWARMLDSSNSSSNANHDAGPADPVQATNDYTALGQQNWGASVQWSEAGRLLARDSQLTLGASAETGHVNYSQDRQEASFTPGRNAVGTGPLLASTRAATRTHTLGLWISHAWQLSPAFTLLSSLRGNLSQLGIADESGSDPRLNGRHRYAGLTPGLGLSWHPAEGLSAWLSWKEGMRIPTAMELTCADPQAPCRLPNAFVSDPPLSAVRARTLEAGLRRDTGGGQGLSLALYRTTLSDDLSFVASGAASAGYFRNAGATVRQGLEINARAARGPWQLQALYALVDAHTGSDLVLPAPANTSADASGNITVPAGSRLPNIPRQLLVLRLGHQAAHHSFGLALVSRSSIFARGDENNQDVHGQVGGYAVLNLDARWTVEPRKELLLRVANLTGRRYASFATLGQNFFTGVQGTYDPSTRRYEQFLGPGAPRSIILGLSLRWE